MPMNAQKLTQFAKAKDYAKSKGGECLSSEYLTAKTKMKWKCDNPTHPAWESTFDIVYSRKAWCNLCYREKQSENAKLVGALEKSIAYAKSRGGQCLSTEYINAKTKMKWKCDNSAHPAWESSYEHVVSRQRWCQQCAYDRAILKNGFQLAQDYAKNKNGQCLSSSNEIIKKHSVLEWKCHNHEHKSWSSTFHSVVELKTWCPYCAGRFSKEEYLEMAKKLAISKGGKCLSSKYIGQIDKLLWQCKNPIHPQFKATYQNVATKNYWCHFCKEEAQKPIKESKLKKAKEHAKSKGGECLSNEYINSDGKLIWKCHNVEHRPWEAKYSNVMGILKRWCPQCAGQFTKEEGLKQAQEYAKSRGGECLSKKYINSNTKMEWKCIEKSHKSWFSTYSTVVSGGYWCNECANSKYYKESSVRIILENILGFKLETSYPIWNMNPHTNKALELDGYNEEQKFAFEFQGRHHFEANVFLNTNLEDVQLKDQIKKENCIKNNIKLLILNDHKQMKKKEDILKYVIEQLKLNNIIYQEPINHEVIFKQLENIYKNSANEVWLEKAQEHAQSKNGQCSSEYYTNYNTPLLWKCHNLEHKPWEAILYSVLKNKSWCPTCAGKTTKEERLEKAKNYVKSKGGDCLSNELVSNKDELIWTCGNSSHKQWSCSYTNIFKHINWCPECLNNKK